MTSSLHAFSKMLFRILTVTVWGITLGMTGLLVLAYFLPQDLNRHGEPYTTLVCVSFFTRVLTFHLGLGLAVIAIFALLVRQNRLLALAGPLAVICLFPTLRFAPPHAPPASKLSLRIMSMNLKYTRDHPELIASQLLKFKPDVVAIQDYTPFAQADIEEAIGDRYPWRNFCFNFYQGLAIYSRLPFVGQVRQTFTKTRRQTRAVILLGNRPIALYVEHPYSPRSKSRILANRLATLDLATCVREETLPVIAAGDFNFTDWTPNEAVLKLAGLSDAFEIAGHGRGSTWPVSPPWMRWLPGVRIDHVFCSRQLTCTHFEVGGFTGSDHLPIVADIAVGD